jgi:hypothetical protein
VREPPHEPLLAPGTRARVVGHPDPDAAGLCDQRGRQKSSQCRIVHVPVNGLNGWTEGSEFGEDVGRDDVAGMKDQVGHAETLETGLRQPPPAAGHVRVGDDGDEQR